jgi:hypothetical protein
MKRKKRNWGCPSDGEDAAAVRREATQAAVEDARRWSAKLLAENGGRPFPPMAELLQEARSEGLE